MTAHELIAEASELCRRLGRAFPAELRAYGSDWQRQGYDVRGRWLLVKRALVGRGAMCQCRL